MKCLRFFAFYIFAIQVRFLFNILKFTFQELSVQWQNKCLTNKDEYRNALKINGFGENDNLTVFIQYFQNNSVEVKRECNLTKNETGIFNLTKECDFGIYSIKNISNVTSDKQTTNYTSFPFSFNGSEYIIVNSFCADFEIQKKFKLNGNLKNFSFPGRVNSKGEGNVNLLLGNITIICNYKSQEESDDTQKKITCDPQNDSNNWTTGNLTQQGKKIYSIYLDTGNGKLLTKWNVDYGNQKFFKISSTFIILIAILLL